jgi:hypothetical protein
MTLTDPFQAGGESLPGFKFASVGDKLVGQIIDARQVPDRDLDGNVRKWDNGDERTVWVFDVDTDSDGTADTSLWVRGNMYTVIRQALIDAKVPTVGALISVEHHALGDPPKKGYHAPKLFTAKAKAGPPLKPKTADPFSGGGDEDESF